MKAAPLQRILVIGPPGAGKSHFARQLGERLGLPVIHLDAHYWSAGWVEPTPAEWASRLAALLARPAWIMDGNYSRTLAQRLAACDTVVFLDLPRWQCMWGLLRRAWTERGRVRADMAAACPEKLDRAFLVFAWRYRSRSRPAVMRLLAQGRDQWVVHRLASRGQARAWLEGVSGRG
ncbi:hypothetical protein P6166_06400 [Stenotrophomonas sp. HITSZ_GD]|uniref:AAA family ATPase n=1 Tax=Stenotrophomonas sp. HITSZ_GD TaxID=3037248 RepID=UPI00240E94B9|nr:AAA family ATPase [Stenotrophomonas sp. HITSZ_GD]MDG2524982.1 hypothetical protein [Stenotrophomonas sp. HITSZ_GD]